MAMTAILEAASPVSSCPSLAPWSFWDWEKGEKLDYFHNGNPRYTRVTAMEYLNGQDCSLLLTATGKRVHVGPAWGPGDRAWYSFLGPWPFAGRGAVLGHSEGHCPRDLGGF